MDNIFCQNIPSNVTKIILECIYKYFEYQIVKYNEKSFKLLNLIYFNYLLV